MRNLFCLYNTMRQGSDQYMSGSFDRRLISWLLAILFFIGIAGYGMGWGAMRYNDEANEPWQSWRYWRHALAMGDPVLLVCCLLIYFVELGTGRGTSFFSRLLFWLLILFIGYLAFFIVWEIVVWTRCNNLTGAIPDYPECINRHYPAHRYPDISFLLMLFGTVASLFAAALVFWFRATLECGATANWVMRQRGYDQEFDVSPMPGPTAQAAPGGGGMVMFANDSIDAPASVGYSLAGRDAIDLESIGDTFYPGKPLFH